MKITEIDNNLCTKCSLCLDECPVTLFQMEDNSYPEIVDPLNSCIRCGHCVAICPPNAIKYEFEEGNNSACFKADTLETVETFQAAAIMKNIMFKRRSVREYKDKQVKKEDLQLILEAMGRSPSASNKMNRNYYIFQNAEVINTLEEIISNFISALLKTALNPILIFFQSLFIKNKKLSLKEKVNYSKKIYFDLYTKIKEKKLKFLFDAPAVVVITAPERVPRMYKMFLSPDAHNAATHGVLMAESLGLGTCWIGFAEIALNKKIKLKTKLGIPKKEKVLAVFTVGYPVKKFKRMAPRGPVPIQWN